MNRWVRGSEPSGDALRKRSAGAQKPGIWTRRRAGSSIPEYGLADGGGVQGEGYRWSDVGGA